MTDKNSLLESIGNGLSAALGETTSPEWVRSLSGGDINKAALIQSGNTRWFVKYHQNAPAGMFAAEAQALTEISAHRCIKAPTPVAQGSDADTAWLVLEHLELTSSGSAALLGEQLTALHSITSNQYGWSRDNYIGTTPQRNTYSEDWTTFWRDCRLKPQLELAQASGHGRQLMNKGERLLESLDQFMDNRQPAACLLHGDLWAGNKAFTTDGQPVIFDPASYFGDRETDIAMTELFGGFEQSFYTAYQSCLPLSDGYRLRRDLYNLYHMLNHLNLFGSRYHSRCVSIIDHLMAQVR